MDQLNYSDLLLSRISELEATYPSEVADKRLVTELANLESVLDESTLCQDFDNEVIDERIPVLDRIHHVRKLYVDEILATLACDAELSHEMAECKKANLAHTKAMETLSAKQKEHRAVVLLRDKLQDLCRMIQQQTKEIIANNGEFVAAEKEKATELDTQFTSSIQQISQQLVEQEKSLELQDAENKELQEKLDQFEEHIVLRSQHYAAQLKAKDLELQLEQAKLAQKEHLSQQETNRNESVASKILAVQASNAEMKTQLGLFAEKFVMFEDALTRSTGMFDQFEQKIAHLDATESRLMEEKKLRKEICCKLDLNLFDLIDEKTRPGQEVEQAQALKANLQNECRLLQQKRTELKMLQKEKKEKSETA